jgi:uncharacterized protein YjbI with pentapeptide repeats
MYRAKKSAVKKSAVVNGYLIESGANLSGADLRGANLRFLKVKNVDFSHADLTGANLRRATIRRSNFEGAILNGANLKECKFFTSDFAGASFEGANLQYTDFDRSALISANFNGARLRETSFSGSDLRGANLENLVLYEIQVSKCNFKGSNLKKIIANGGFFTASDFSQTKIEGAKFIKTKFIRSNLSELNFEDCVFLKTRMSACKLIDANFSGRNMTGSTFFASKMKNADLSRANLTRCDFEKADLSRADLRGANLRGADFTGASLVSTKLDGAKVNGALFPTPPTVGGSYGLMTGPILKMNRPDSPLRAQEFKKSYPYEFERLKADMGGRDFNEGMKVAIKNKYFTPFDWVLTRKMWKYNTQRVSKNPNTVIMLNIDTENSKYTDREKRLLQALIRLFSEHPMHPRERSPLLTIGWVRYAIDERHKVMLIEEVQTDIHNQRIRTIPASYLARYDISLEELHEAVAIIKPALDRFYEDAIGLIYEEAAARGYTVEMLGYEDKLPFCYTDDDGIERCPPKPVYTDLPRRMGMREKRDSAVPVREPLLGKVSYYKPNPGIPPRYQQECCVCGEPGSLMASNNNVFCEDCF